MPIKVPNTEYCWDGRIPCKYFTNEGGHGRCELGIYGVERDDEHLYPKPDECLKFVKMPE